MGLVAGWAVVVGFFVVELFKLSVEKDKSGQEGSVVIDVKSLVVEMSSVPISDSGESLGKLGCCEMSSRVSWV